MRAAVPRTCNLSMLSGLARKLVGRPFAQGFTAAVPQHVLEVRYRREAQYGAAVMVGPHMPCEAPCVVKYP